MEWTGQRYADTPAVAVETYIDAPPERVWALVSDINLMPGLSTELQEVEWLDGVTKPAAGCRFRGRNATPLPGELGDGQHDRRPATSPVSSDGRSGTPVIPRRPGGSPCARTGQGTLLEQRAQMGPGRSGLNLAIDAMPENEQKIVFVRLREFEAGLTSNVATIKELAEGPR